MVHILYTIIWILILEMGESKPAFCSIPTKYQTYVINNSEDKKGFRSKSKRFLETFNDTPGPGTYQTFEGSSNPSFGKKGTGGFASRSKRMPKYSQKSCPNPTSYNLPRDLNNRRDFNKSYSSSFQKPIAKETKYSVTRKPAPNQYNTSKGILGKNITPTQILSQYIGSLSAWESNLFTKVKKHSIK